MVAACALGFAGVAAPSAWAQTDEQRAAARAAATEAVRAFGEGRYADAADLCTRAESLMHAPTHLLLLARSQAKLGHLVQAQEAYFKIKGEDLPADAPKAFARAQQVAQEELAALEPRVPKLKITIQGADMKDVSLTIDRTAVPRALVGLSSPIDPGQHTIEGKAAAFRSEPVTINIPEGTTQSVILKFEEAPQLPQEPAAAVLPVAPEAPTPPPQQAARTPVAAWVGLGVGAAGLVAGGVFVALNHADRASANNDCGPNLCPDSKRADITSLDNHANKAATLAWVSFAVGVAGISTGAVLYFFRGNKPTDVQPTAADLRPWVDSHGGGLGLSGVF